MLLELTINDFAIIDQLRIPFEPGLNVLTGETGAGKSIIIDALGAVLGERIGPDVVRTGSRLARIEATFDVSGMLDRPDIATTLNELGVEPEDGVLILSREMTSSGRSTRACLPGWARSWSISTGKVITCRCCGPPRILICSTGMQA
jgi:DNA repair protein RecN (Recombination protein N)